MSVALFELQAETSVVVELTPEQGGCVVTLEALTPAAVIELAAAVPGPQGERGEQGEAAYVPAGPQFTYGVGGELTAVVYDDGAAKAFTYDAQGRLTQVDFSRPAHAVVRKAFNYDTAGRLTSIDQTEI